MLEVLQILEAEVHLREDTRVAQQSRPALEQEKYKEQALALSQRQRKLQERIDKVTERIEALPDAQTEFGFEIKLLGRVSQVMDEATEILARPETGRPALAAETEAIELLLQSRRFNPGGGGGGGRNPGGGGGGTTHDSALSLIGTGVNEKEVRQAPGAGQATGTAGTTLPEEFRQGLDTYFNRLEQSAKPR